MSKFIACKCFYLSYSTIGYSYGKKIDYFFPTEVASSSEHRALDRSNSGNNDNRSKVVHSVQLRGNSTKVPEHSSNEVSVTNGTKYMYRLVKKD